MTLDRKVAQERERVRRLRIVLAEIAAMEAPTYSLTDATGRAATALLDDDNG
jgi:hypothetical protein